jgi:hypothetical protein
MPRRYQVPLGRTGIAVFVTVVVICSLGVAIARWAIPSDLHLALPPVPACVVTESNGSTGTASRSGGAPNPTASAFEGERTVTLNPDRMANAATIAALGLRRSVPRRGIVVALATALQESKLDNLDGGDRDSVGLFQQRPSQGWGTTEQLADPRFATNAFYTALLKVPGWQKLPVTEAAQAVQHSAYPGAYEQWATNAEVLTSALAGESSGAVGCTLPSTSERTGSAAVTALVDSFRLDWGEAKAPAATPADSLDVALAVRDAKIGWQYAHWLVSHAKDQGIRRVRFADREWTPKSGSWKPVTASKGTQPPPGQVRAEVYPPQ